VILGVSAAAVWSGGITAAFGPEMMPVYLALACGALAVGSRRPRWVSVTVMAVIFAVMVAAVWARADLVPPARISRWLALAPLLALAEIRRFRSGWEDWMGPAAAICTAGLVLLWRADRYGPVLATLRGEWQQPLALAPRAFYHVGTALVFALLLALATLLVARLPERVGRLGAWCVLGVATLLVVFDLVSAWQQWLLLHLPPSAVG
jgi:hypothetical protein